MRCLIVFVLASALLVVFASAAPTSTVLPSLDDKKSNEVTPGIDDKKEGGDKSDNLKTTAITDDKEVTKSPTKDGKEAMEGGELTTEEPKKNDLTTKGSTNGGKKVTKRPKIGGKKGGKKPKKGGKKAKKGGKSRQSGKRRNNKNRKQRQGRNAQKKYHVFSNEPSNDSEVTPSQ